jgi:hypothetical protein
LVIVVQLLEHARHLLLELRDRQRRADTGDDVLALRVDEVLAVEDVLRPSTGRA